MFARSVIFEICKVDLTYLRIYNNMKHARFGLEFNDGDALATIFQALCDLVGQENIGEDIGDIFRKG